MLHPRKSWFLGSRGNIWHSCRWHRAKGVVVARTLKAFLKQKSRESEFERHWLKRNEILQVEQEIIRGQEQGQE